LQHLHYKKNVVLLIIFFIIARCIVGASIEFGNDESYYWLYSQHLQWNYFDHPPMVALLARFFTANLLLQDHILFLRMGSIVSCALATWFIFKCVTVIKDERAGWFAACLYSASYYAGITAGLFLMPDSPQMIFWTLSLWMIARIAKDERKWLNWILLGIASGLCIISKVHGVFIWTGLGLFILLKKRNWLSHPKLYMALLLALLISSPIIIWNIQNNFITYRFQSERVVISGYKGNLYSLFKAFVSQVVINNPVNVVLITAALIAFLNRKIKPAALSIFNFTALPFIFIILFMSFFRKTLPHWTGPAFVSLIPLAAIWLSELKTKIVFPLAIKLSLGCYLAFLIGCTLFINYYPGTTGNKTGPTLGQGDITLDMYGWENAGKAFETIYKNDIKGGIMTAGTPLVCNNWWGAHEEYYFCRPLKIAMIGLGPLEEIHQYAWLNNERSQKASLSQAYCIIHSDENYNAYEAYGKYYSAIDTAAVIEIDRNEKPAHRFYVLRLKGWKNTPLSIAP
jgi:4-amino-4-deoxy-L-arabinose transferase-like glycosyltransferase